MTSDADSPRRLGFLSFSEKNIQRIVTILKWYYFVFVCLGSFVLLGGLLIGYKLPQLFNIAGIFLLPLLIYLGIKKRNNWVIVVIVIQSAVNILYAFFRPVPLQNTLGPVAGILIKITSMVFDVFQIYFFTRKEVRKYFNAKDGIIL